MKIEGLKELATQKKLEVHKCFLRNETRRKYIWSEDGKIVKVEKIPWKKFFFSCRTEDMPEHQAYKLNKKDFYQLLKLGAIEK